MPGRLYIYISALVHASIERVPDAGKNAGWSKVHASIERVPDAGKNAGECFNTSKRYGMHVMYICISVFMNYDCTTYPILLFITLLQSLFWNISLKKHLIQRCWIVISFLSVDSKQRNHKKIHFDPSFNLSQGEVDDFSGQVQKNSGEVPTSPQNPPMTKFWNLFKDTFWHFLRHLSAR
jgi:hypothetical protein